MKTLICALALLASTAAHAKPTFDHVLTPAELKSLLPVYAAFVEAHAAEVPSANDEQNIIGLGWVTNRQPITAFANGKNGGVKIIGQKSQTPQSVAKELADAAKEMESRTSADRQAEAVDLLAGFRGDKDAGKLTCRLGYTEEGKQATSRTVTCVDDRSVNGQGDEEGYYDVRKFILSIDAKTLQPVGVLRLNHMIAG